MAHVCVGYLLWCDSSVAHVCVGYLLWCDSSMSRVWGTYSGGAPQWAVCGVLTLVGLLGGPCLCGVLTLVRLLDELCVGYFGETPQ